MIERYEIERAVENFIAGPDLDLALLKYNKKDSLIIGELVMKLNYLKHKYYKALYSNDNSEEIFERICQIYPGFLLMEE